VRRRLTGEAIRYRCCQKSHWQAPTSRLFERRRRADHLVGLACEKEPQPLARELMRINDQKPECPACYALCFRQMSFVMFHAGCPKHTPAMRIRMSTPK
jgi:hypothetical protein